MRARFADRFRGAKDTGLLIFGALSWREVAAVSGFEAPACLRGMHIAYLAVTSLAALMNAFAACMNFAGAEYVRAVADKVQVSQKWLVPFGILLAAGAVGLAAGFAVPALGAAAGPLQPARPRRGARDDPALPRRRRRRDPVEPAGPRPPRPAMG